MSERFLVTGACGYIGRNVVRALLGEGLEVAALDLPGAPFDVLPDGVQKIAGDLVHDEVWKSEVASFSPTHVVHLAARLDPGRDPALFEPLFAVNVTGTLRLARALEKAPLAAFLHASTGEEYGNVTGRRHEDLPARPVSPYSTSKTAATALLQALHAMSGFPALTVRMFLPYGEGNSPRFFVTQLAAAIRRGEPFAMTPGEQTRDLLHIDDVVRGLLLAARCQELVGGVVNLCSGEGIKLVDLAGRAEALARREGLLASGFAIRAGELPYREAEVMEYVGDPAKMTRATGFRPEVSLDEGLLRVLRAG